MEQLSFYQQRMQALGVTKENNQIEVFNPEAEFPANPRSVSEIFTEDAKGNIRILYTTITGELIVYYNDNKTPAPRFYYQTRLKDPQNGKYRTPKGQGTFPFFHKKLIKAYAEKQKIETLFLTEGAFKAWKACECGIDVVGLTSVTTYARDGKLHADIERLIIQCEVERVVVLHDGDCKDISANHLYMREELTQRPMMFYNAAKAITKLVKKINFPKTREAPKVYYQYIRAESYNEKPKGLDDLLITAEQYNETAAIVKAATKLDKKSKWFKNFHISKSAAMLFQHFGLHEVEVFYQMHGDEIEDTEFLFHGDKYRWSDNKNELELLAPAWAKQVVWIGDEFFVIRKVPGATRDRKQLLKRSKDTLRDLYGKDFLQYLKHYEAFCNVPNHFDYEQVIETDNGAFYNRYFPFKWIPEEGECNTIINFVKHIFGDDEVVNGLTGETYRSWELGLDYCQILLCEPTQILPVLCLYSQENNTGKSTFGKLLMEMFGDNAIQISNSDLQSDFNELYSDKLLAICEETLLERKKDAERIKSLSTSDQVSVNPKNQRQFMLDFFCKFQFYSNNKRMIYLSKHDERFWIVTVPRPTKDIPNLLYRMKKQIPAFVHFLKNRQLATKRESRMHFHYTLIRTEGFQQTVLVNEPQVATDIRDRIHELFLMDADLQEIQMPLKDIHSEFCTASTSKPWLQELLKDYIEVSLYANKEGKHPSLRGKFPRFVYDPVKEDIVRKDIPFRGRPYIFKRAQFINDTEDISYDASAEETELVSADTPF